MYKGKEFTSDMIQSYVGFVYIITNIENDMKYVGKKLFVKKQTLPPLKGNKKKRKIIKESDWQSYYGSSTTVQTLVEEKGSELFKREILHLCNTKGEMSWLELKEQVDRNVLLRNDYYNGIVQVKIHRSHLKTLKFTA